MKHIRKFNEKWSPSDRSDMDLAEDIANDLLPKLNLKRKNGEIVSTDELTNLMQNNGAPLSMVDTVMAELVYLGFEFD